MSTEGLQVVCSESLAHLPRVSTSRCTELDGPIGTLKVGSIVVKGGGFPLFRVAKRDVKSFGLATWDFSAFKTTNLRERLALQFRAEIFNLLNRANFNTPNLITFTSSASGTKVSGTAGAITSTSTTSRQVQFGLKLIW